MPIIKYVRSAIHGGSYYFHTLSAGSLNTLIQRIPRFRKIVGSILRMDITPPLPIRLQIETTDVCNLKCIMCSREILGGLNAHEISLDEFIKVIDAIEPYYVTMNGLGEPLIDKTIFEKLAYLRSKGIFISMPTNGSFIRGDTLRILLKNLPDRLQLSIDGATKETFEAIRKVSDFEDVMSNFRSLCERRFEDNGNRRSTIGIECTLQRQNLYEFREMYVLYSGLPKIDSFSLVPVFNYEPEGRTFSGIIPSSEEVRALHRQLGIAIQNATTPKESAFYRNWMDVSAQWIGTDGPEALNPDKNCHACIVPWYNVYIDARGRVYPCCFLIATENIMGNIFDEPFQSIWTSQRYLEFRNRIVRDRPNLQGCRTCPRNDDSRIRQFNKLRIFLGS